jgi:hypothetical protein
MKTILVVDDEVKITQPVRDYLGAPALLYRPPPTARRPRLAHRAARPDRARPGPPLMDGWT